MSTKPDGGGGPIPEMLDVSVARKMGQRNTYTDNLKKKIKKSMKTPQTTVTHLNTCDKSTVSLSDSGSIALYKSHHHHHHHHHDLTNW